MMILRKLASRLYTSRPKFTVLFSSAGVIFSNFFFRNAASKLYPYKLKKFLNSRVSFKIFHLKCFSFFYLIYVQRHNYCIFIAVRHRRSKYQSFRDQSLCTYLRHASTLKIYENTKSSFTYIYFH